MNETTIVTEVRATMSRGDVRLWRNNVGVLQDRTGGFVTYGLCPGSSDLIGYKSVVITNDMVGMRVAVFCALEGKRDRRTKPTRMQQDFINLVISAGGIAGVFTDVESASQLIHGRVAK